MWVPPLALPSPCPPMTPSHNRRQRCYSMSRATECFFKAIYCSSSHAVLVFFLQSTVCSVYASIASTTDVTVQLPRQQKPCTSLVGWGQKKNQLRPPFLCSLILLLNHTVVLKKVFPVDATRLCPLSKTYPTTPHTYQNVSKNTTFLCLVWHCAQLTDFWSL